MLSTSMVDVVNPENVGNEETVEFASFENLGEFRPVL
jgi:hypothetical protein